MKRSCVILWFDPSFWIDPTRASIGELWNKVDPVQSLKIERWEKVSLRKCDDCYRASVGEEQSEKSLPVRSHASCPRLCLYRVRHCYASHSPNQQVTTGCMLRCSCAVLGHSLSRYASSTAALYEVFLPPTWYEANITLLFKKGDRSLPADFAYSFHQIKFFLSFISSLNMLI